MMIHPKSATPWPRALLSPLAGLLFCFLATGAAFADYLQDGLDNTQLTFFEYAPDGIPPSLVTVTGDNGDSIQLGPIGFTGSVSKEVGFYFDIVGPGSVTFRWQVSGQAISSGIGTILQYYLINNSTSGVVGSNYITGTTTFQQATVNVPTGSHRILLSYVRSANASTVGSDSGWVDQVVWTPSSGPDTTPDAFSFNAQTDVALSTVATSNTITVSGITAATPISISGCTGSACQYSINSGAWTSTAGTVVNGNTVQVRQTSSASNATTTALTLDIGGVTAAFNVTTVAAPTPVLEGQTPTGTGTARAFAEFTGNSEGGCSVSQSAFVNAPTAPPPGVTLPHGMFGFTASGCTSGFSVDVRIEYPSPIPPGASYWKYDPVNGWYTIPATIAGNTVSFTIVDNGVGDTNAAAGTITDPGGIGIGGTAAIPTLSQWALIVLSIVMGLMAWFTLRRRMA